MLGKKIFDLCANWEYRKAGETEWKPAIVPGNIHLDLFENKEIEDPFYGDNAKKQQWIEKCNWEYRSFFEADDELFSKNIIDLSFDGLDTFAYVYLNGYQVLASDNMFRKWTAPIKSNLQPGTNELRILFHSPYNKGLEKLESYGFQLPANNEEGSKKVSSYIRKAPYHFGWDWGPRLATSGIYRNVYISAWNIAEIENIQIIQELVQEDFAKIKFSLQIKSIRKYDAIIRIIKNGEPWTEKCFALKEGSNKYEQKVQIEDPELWWPNGMGDPNLYKLDFQLELAGEIIDSKKENLGLRTVELVREPDRIGSSFHFDVNDKSVFIKGANIIPFDYFLPRTSKETIKKYVLAAKEANFNMLRAWGGAAYELDYFYELCDEHGILVWQDFVFACGMYPANDEFLETVKEEAIYNIKRLRNHPCIAIWCGNNEILEAFHTWGWKDDLGENADKAFEDYEKIFYELLPEILKEHAPVKQYWPSSPSSGYKSLLNFEAGDYHYWDIVKEDLPISTYKDNVGRFMSEYGFKGYPELKTLKTYSEEKDWELRNPIMEFHQGWFRGAELIEKNLERELPKPKDWENFLYSSQVLQAQALKVAIEAHRRNKPYCMGTLYWQLNDVWPTASWSTIDYYGRWKAAHYYLKKLYADILVSPCLNEETGYLSVFVNSDLHQKFEATLEIKVINLKGETFWNKTINTPISENSNTNFFEEELEKILGSNKAEESIIITTLTKENEIIATNSLFACSLKNIKWIDPQLQYELTQKSGNYELHIKSSFFAKDIYISFKHEDCLLSDNYFDLLPNESRLIKINSDQKLEELKKQLSVISLFNSFN